jgi:hypothetical protein
MYFRVINEEGGGKRRSDELCLNKMLERADAFRQEKGPPFFVNGKTPLTQHHTAETHHRTRVHCGDVNIWRSPATLRSSLITVRSEESYLHK